MSTRLQLHYDVKQLKCFKRLSDALDARVPVKMTRVHSEAASGRECFRSEGLDGRQRGRQVFGSPARSLVGLLPGYTGMCISEYSS